MAENPVAGSVLEIPKKVLENLETLDKKINSISSSSDEMAKRFNSAMQTMSSSSDDLISKLTTINSLIKGVGGIKIPGLDIFAKGIQSVSTESSKAVDNVSRAAQAMNKFSNTDMNRALSSMLMNLKELNEDIKIYKNAIGTGKKSNIDFGQKGLAEAVPKAEELMRAITALDEAQRRLSQSGGIFKSYMDDVSGKSLSSRRYEEDMKEMRAYYGELEKTSAHAAAQAEKEDRRKQAAAERAAVKAEKAKEREAKAAEKAAEREMKANERAAAQAEKEIQRKMAAQAKFESRMRRANYTDYVTSTEGSLRTADRANTFYQRAQAIKNVEAAMKRLRTTDANYEADLKRLSTAHKNLTAQQQAFSKNLGVIAQRQSHLMDISGQLARRLALVFSVSQVTGFIRKMVEVRGEFELQQTALGAMLQDMDKAEALFGKITELAVVSPFTVKELTTYTKSLAAYQVEYEKLYDTTKMLADVSAGLGVDMQRLILAFGQVKAANFLRGCLGYGTPVMLYDGTIKQVQDIVVGDVLINEKGEPVNVLELIRGRETMFLVEQVSGHNRTSYRVNRNHILTLWNVQEQRLEDVYVYDYLKNTEAYLGLRIVDGEKVYYDIEVTKDRIDDYYGFVLDGNKRFRLGDGTITHNTETRQFTEAGINMLGELAKYYSELEDRIVSVGEVQDMQFRRMISFQDVEEVFKRMTSAGGMFYEMQEKQSETLRGQISNMRDQFDLMFNDMGQSTQGALMAMINLTKSAVSNWETLARVISPIATTLLMAVSASKLFVARSKGASSVWSSILSLIQQAKLNITQAGKAQDGFNKIASRNAWLAMGAVAVTVIWEVINAIRAATKEQRELNKIVDEGYTQYNVSVAKYKELADTVDDSTKSYKEQKEALDELQRSYQDILPSHYLEADAIRAMKGNYDEATNAIENYIAAKTKEKQLQYIQENYGEDLSKAEENLVNTLISNMERLYELEEIPRSAMREVVEELKKGISAGEITIVNGFDELIKITRNKLNMKPSKSGIFSGNLTRDFLDYYKALHKLNDELNEIEKSSIRFGDAITYNLNQQREALDKQIDKAKEYLNVISQQGDVGKEGALITQEQVDDAKGKLAEIVKEWGIDAETIQNLSGGAFEIKEFSVELNKAALKDFKETIEAMETTDLTEGSVSAFVQSLNTEIEKLDPTVFQEWTTGIIEGATKVNKISMDNLIKYLASASESTTEYRKRIEDEESNLQSLIKDYELNEELVSYWDEDEYNESVKKLKVLKALLAELRYEEPNGRGGDNYEKRLRNLISLIQKAGSEYQKLLRYNTEAASSMKVETAFRPSLERAFEDVGFTVNFDYDVDGIIDGIEQVLDSVPEKYKGVVEEVLSVLKTERDFKISEESINKAKGDIESIFKDYDFNLSLRTNNVDRDILGDFFRQVGGTELEVAGLGLDINSFEEMQEKVRAKIEELQAMGGENALDMAAEYQAKLTEMEVKEAQNRYDELIRLREKYNDNTIKIAAELEKIDRLNAENEWLEGMTDEPSKKQKELNDLLIQESQDVILQLRSEAIQLTDFWRTLFGDLDDVSSNTLRRLQRSVKEIVKNATPIKNNQGRIKGYNSSFVNEYGETEYFQLTISQMEQLLKKNEEVYDKISEKNPFQALIESTVDMEIARRKYLQFRSVYESLVKLRKAGHGDIKAEAKAQAGMNNALSSFIAAMNTANTASGRVYQRMSDIFDVVATLGDIVGGTFGELANELVQIGNTAKQAGESVSGLLNNIASLAGEESKIGTALSSAAGPVGLVFSFVGAIGGIFSRIDKAQKEYTRKEEQRMRNIISTLDDYKRKLVEVKLELEDPFGINMFNNIITSIQAAHQATEDYYSMLNRYSVNSQKMYAGLYPFFGQEVAESALKTNREDLKYITKHGKKRLIRKDIPTETQNLEDWVRENMGAELFNEDGRLNLEVAEVLLENADNLYGDTEEVLRSLMEQEELIREAEEEYKNSVYEMFSGFGDELSDALVTAFRNGTDAAEDLQSTLEGILENFIVEMAKSVFLQPILQEYADNVMKATEDYNKDMEEASNAGGLKKQRKEAEAQRKYAGQLANATDNAFDKIEDSTKNIFDFFEMAQKEAEKRGLDILMPDEAEGDTMTGLQKGIQGITEETAQAVEALLESIRLFVSQENTNVAGILAILLANTQGETPLMQELRFQTSHLASIDSLLSSVSKNVTSNGRALKVQIV